MRYAEGKATKQGVALHPLGSAQTRLNPSGSRLRPLKSKAKSKAKVKGQVKNKSQKRKSKPRALSAPDERTAF